MARRPRDVGGQHHRVGFERATGGVYPVAPGAAGLDPGDAGAGAHLDVAGGQVALQRVPEGHVEPGVGHVEHQALAGAQEVDVEHGGQLGGRHLVRGSEEAAGEHLEGQVPGRGREVDLPQERLRVHLVQPVVDAGHGHRGQRRGRGGVQRHQVAGPERRAAQREGQGVPRWGPGQAAEGVPAAVRVDQRVVGQRDQPGQPGVGPAQQGAQVVVLPEEGVEAPAHGQAARVAGGRRLGPAADPATQVGFALHERDPDAAFGQPGGGGQPGDAAAGHHDVRA